MRAIIEDALPSALWVSISISASILIWTWVNHQLIRVYQWQPHGGSLNRWLPDLTPRFLFNIIFACNATNLIQSGYKTFKHTAFRLIRGDGEVIVLPVSLLEELSMLPPSTASPNGALEHDLLGSFTGTDLILDSRMHHTVVQRKLTPRLPWVTPGLEKKLNLSFKDCFPQCNDWTTIMPYQVIGRLSAVLAGKTMVGEELCNDPTWIDISINFTESLFRTVVVLRLFPPWLRNVLCHFLPSYWYGKEYVKLGKRLLAPKIATLLHEIDTGTFLPQRNDEEPNVLTWLVESAKGRDRDPEILAHIQVLLALASVHTSLLRMVNVLYDLATQPSLVTELRKEIESQQYGENGWTVASYAKLEKLDSVLRESQRMSPPSVLGMKRIFLEPYTFADGTRVREGAYVCMPVYAIQNDPDHTAKPGEFDGLRTYNRRRMVLESSINPQEKSRGTKSKESFDDSIYLFSSPDREALHFGYGRFACPGRHFASLAIKMLLVKILSEYDFEFLPGHTRPRNLVFHEFLFSWPWTKMMIRRRKDGVSPF